jgi:hypothetical protein
MVGASSVNDRLCCLACSWTKLKCALGHVYLGIVDKVIEKSLAVPRPVLVKLLGHGIEDLAEFHYMTASGYKKITTRPRHAVIIAERGGFEPPVPLPAQLLSREPDSATLEPLHGGFSNQLFGERGIRTPGNLRLNGFQDRLLRPLGHLSSC